MNVPLPSLKTGGSKERGGDDFDGSGGGGGGGSRDLTNYFLSVVHACEFIFHNIMLCIQDFGKEEAVC